MLKGVKLKVDFRDWHFHELVGSAHPSTFADEYDADAGLTFPVQDFANTECTAITVTDMCTDQDGIVYSFDYQMMKTLVLMGLGPDADGADPRRAASVPIYIGLLEDSLAAVRSNKVGQHKAVDPSLWPADLDTEAAKHKKPAYLRADTGPHDVFDNIRSAQSLALDEKRSGGIATPWYGEWEDETGSDGILLEAPKRCISEHMFKACGWVVHNSRGDLIRHGEPFLKVKSWNSKVWGDNGYCYLSRSAVNRQFNQPFNPQTWASFSFVYEKVDPNTAESLSLRKSELTDVVLQFLMNKLVRLQAALNKR